MLSLLLALCALIDPAHSATFNPSATSVSPSYANSLASQYSFTFTAVTPFIADFDLYISFPSPQFAPLPPSACSFLVNSVPVSSAVCQLDGSNIKFTSLSLTQTISSIQVIFNTSTAGYSGTAVLTFSYYNPTTGWRCPCSTSSL